MTPQQQLNRLFADLLKWRKDPTLFTASQVSEMWAQVDNLLKQLL